MTQSDERLKILEMIHHGKISAEEGLKLMEALGESWEQDGSLEADDIFDEGEILAESPQRQDEDLNRWSHYWIIPFWIGIGITVLGGALMYWAWSARGLGVGFVLAWIPFLLGTAVMVLGWNSRTGPWIHIRVQQKPGETPEKISISLPLPVRFLAWSIRTFRRWDPDIPVGVDKVLLALGSYSQGDAPLSINVDDDGDGQKVIVYIG